MKNLILIIAFCAMLASCSTYQKQQKKFVKFASDYPSELARLCSDRFPTVPEIIEGKTDTIKGETIYIKGDSIPCPDGSKVKAPDQQVDCPPSTHTRDTLKIENKAKIYLLQKTIQDLQLSIDKKNSEFDIAMKKKDDQIKDLEKEIEKKDKRLFYRLLIIIGLGVVMVGSIILKVKKII